MSRSRFSMTWTLPNDLLTPLSVTPAMARSLGPVVDRRQSRRLASLSRHRQRGTVARASISRTHSSRYWFSNKPSEKESSMSAKKLWITGLLSMALAAGAVSVAAADDAAMPAGVKGDMMVWIKDAEDKLTQLAEATPEAKYSWKPSKGVRTQAEVFM